MAEGEFCARHLKRKAERILPKTSPIEKSLAEEIAAARIGARHLKRKAERKFLADDIAGARILAHDALFHCSSISGLSDMVVAIDVLFAAATKKLPSGQTDWFSILGVDVSADLGTAKKRYMTLALQTHPDKNKSAAAGAAFTVVKQAWDAVSSSLAMRSSSTSCSRGTRNTSYTAPSMSPRRGGGRSPSASEASTPPRRRNTPFYSDDKKYGRSRSKAPSTGGGKYACPFCHVEFSCSLKAAWDCGATKVLMRCPTCQERIYLATLD